MAPEELNLDSPEFRPTIGGGTKQPVNSGPLNVDSANLSTNTADESSEDSVADLVRYSKVRTWTKTKKMLKVWEAI